jgi:hypothetical protein
MRSVTLPRANPQNTSAFHTTPTANIFFLTDIMVRKDPIFEARTNVKVSRLQPAPPLPLLAACISPRPDNHAY